MDVGEQEGGTTFPTPACEVLQALRDEARNGELPSVFLRRIAERSPLSLRDLLRALTAAFGLSVRDSALLALWPPVGTGPVTDEGIDAVLVPAIAKTREMWDTAGWSFADSVFTIAASTESVLAGESPILSARRDVDMALWHFHDGLPRSFKDAQVVTLWHVLQLDPTVGELANLPPGWVAERDAVGEPWRRRPHAEE